MTVEKKDYADYIRVEICKKNMRYAYDLFRIFSAAGTALTLFGVILNLIPANYNLVIAMSGFCLSAALLMAGILIGINVVDHEIHIWGEGK